MTYRRIAMIYSKMQLEGSLSSLISRVHFLEIWPRQDRKTDFRKTRMQRRVEGANMVRHSKMQGRVSTRAFRSYRIHCTEIWPRRKTYLRKALRRSKMQGRPS